MKLVRWFFIAALLIFPVIAFAQAKPVDERAKYIGYKYKGVTPESMLPNGVKHMGGGLVGDINADPVYGVSIVAKGKTQMLWFEESTGQDASGVTGWLVKDVLVFPALTKSDYLLFGGDPAVECKGAGELIAVGKLIRRQAIFKPTKAWTANVKTGKFEERSIKGLSCIYSEP